MRWQEMNKEELEYEYNPRVTVADFADFFQIYADASNESRDRTPHQLDLRYGVGPLATLDWYGDHVDGPLHVFVHGGYWRSQDKKDYGFVAAELVRHGMNVAIVNYDLCPTVTIGDINVQCVAAVDFLLNHPAVPSFDSKALSISGHSAGGQIVADLLHYDWQMQKGYSLPLCTAMTISGVFDLEPIRHTSINDDVGLSQETARQYSPIYSKRHVDAPIFVCVGSQESRGFQSQSENYFSTHCSSEQGDRLATIDDCHHFSILLALFSAEGTWHDEVLNILLRSK